jgi:hypothetical protein
MAGGHSKAPETKCQAYAHHLSGWSRSELEVFLWGMFALVIVMLWIVSSAWYESEKLMK